LLRLTKILVPIDFSECSERALEVAFELAKAFGAEVHIAHVYPPSAYVAPPLVPGPVMIGQFRDQSQQAFDEYRSKLSRDRGTPIAGTLLEGTPHVEIVKHATELGADLIAMGTHGRTGVEHLLIGSVAERVIRTAQMPVLTVPPTRR